MAEPAPSPLRRDAMDILARSSRTRHELVESLVRRGHEQADADATAADFLARGWLNDRECGLAACRRLLARGPAGAAMLISRLRARGIDDALASEIAAEVLEGTDPVERGLDLARRQLATMPGVDSTRMIRRVSAVLARRGFDEDTVETVDARLDLDPEDGERT